MAAQDYSTMNAAEQKKVRIGYRVAAVQHEKSALAELEESRALGMPEEMYQSEAAEARERIAKAEAALVREEMA
jgi:hypothetical protein